MLKDHFTNPKYGSSWGMNPHTMRRQTILPGWRHLDMGSTEAFRMSFCSTHYLWEEQPFISELIPQCFSAAWTMINMWVENHWTGVIKWLLVSWSSFYMVEGPCISVSQSVLFPRIFLLFHVSKLDFFTSLSLDSSVFKKSVVTLYMFILSLKVNAWSFGIRTKRPGRG